MTIDNFCRKLRQEAELWRDEGLIDAGQYDQLAQRYQFNQIETVNRDRFSSILIAVGSILLGLGAITFVAANWQVWSRELKLTLLLGLFFVANISGFYLWRQPISSGEVTSRRLKKILGQGLLLLGALILGANLALLAQMFHISGSSYQLFLAWGLGVLVMAYSLRLTSLGILAIILMQLGYGIGLNELYSPGELTWTRLVVEHMPLLAGLLFVPLALECRSRAIFTLAALSFVTSWQFNLHPLEFSENRPWIAATAFVLPPALLWSVPWRQFQPIARTLTLIFFSILFYILSFQWFWHSSDNYSVSDRYTSPIVDIVILCCLALWQWWLLVSRRRQQPRVDLNTIVIGGFIVLTAFIPLWHGSISHLGVIAILAFNALLAMLACGLIRQGLELSQRRAFWGGMVLLTLQIITRMLEYETGLLLKSLIFVLCGIAVIVAGLWFERHLSALSQ